MTRARRRLIRQRVKRATVFLIGCTVIALASYAVRLPWLATFILGGTWGWWAHVLTDGPLFHGRNR